MSANDFILSSAGVRMPGIIYGTAWKQERTAALVEQAITLGFRGIDTACQPKHYHEAGVGEGVLAACRALGLQRSELYLQTKFTPLNGHDPLRIPYDAKASLPEQVARSFQVSLKNLHTDYLDGLVLHSPLADREQLMEVWQALEVIQQSGAAKQLGISNCYDPALFEFLYENATVKPAVLQNRFYADTGYDKQLRAFCRQRQIVYQSFWTLTANPKILADSAVKALAEKYQRGPAQIFFRYLTQIGIVPLTGTTSAEHISEDLAIFEFELTSAECASVTALL
ncbi:aldo/keto reductase family protein [Methylomonas methanica]|uniref:Aldo/keto reductase n=1 Tax=Methylomonas methanica TaxID=421 RepID=A0A177M1C9_METMH|nr:aldo/keto reductase [Methylomonas methanica]OAH99052.1 aldo/keto reductase [Methylomonas methanica]